jgi:hypothetical protein
VVDVRDDRDVADVVAGAGGRSGGGHGDGVSHSRRSAGLHPARGAAALLASTR